MEIDEWQELVAWYETNAPDHLAELEPPIRSQSDQFEIELPATKDHDFPTNTAIHIDATSHRLLLGDSYAFNLDVYSAELVLEKEIPSGGAISRIVTAPENTYLATSMGGNIGQSEVPLGLLIKINANTQTPSAINRLVQRLHRPVDVIADDFNGDGKTDYVIAEFGAYAGKLSLHLSQQDEALHETVLLNEAGAISIAVAGNDLMVLVAQGDERIVRINDFAGNQPISQTLLRFPPSQGSSSMKMLDFNNDGLADLLYTAGDNADISPIFKPYHGIYLFLGQPNNSFQLETFFHLDGAYGAVAEDFDQDGDYDIAAVSYFPNISNGLDETTFVYLENTNGNFEAKYIEGIGGLGRFIAITAGDIDNDGDLDIALANLAFGPYGPLSVTPELQKQWLRGTGFILLRNTLH